MLTGNGSIRENCRSRGVVGLSNVHRRMTTRHPEWRNIPLLKPALRFAGLCLIAFPLHAQQAADHVALGIVATEARDLRAALQQFEAALKQDSMNYEANWRAALTLGLLGDPFPMRVKAPGETRCMPGRSAMPSER